MGEMKRLLLAVAILMGTPLMAFAQATLADTSTARSTGAKRAAMVVRRGESPVKTRHNCLTTSKLEEHHLHIQGTSPTNPTISVSGVPQLLVMTAYSALPKPLQ